MCAYTSILPNVNIYVKFNLPLDTFKDGDSVKTFDAALISMPSDMTEKFFNVLEESVVDLTNEESSLYPFDFANIEYITISVNSTSYEPNTFIATEWN